MELKQARWLTAISLAKRKAPRPLNRTDEICSGAGRPRISRTVREQSAKRCIWSRCFLRVGASLQDLCRSGGANCGKYEDGKEFFHNRSVLFDELSDYASSKEKYTKKKLYKNYYLCTVRRKQTFRTIPDNEILTTFSVYSARPGRFLQTPGI